MWVCKYVCKFVCIVKYIWECLILVIHTYIYIMQLHVHPFIILSQLCINIFSPIFIHYSLYSYMLPCLPSCRLPYCPLLQHRLLLYHFDWTIHQISIFCLKGKLPQTTMWIGWVESNFRNPIVKFWANLDNQFKRTKYAKFCMSPSLDGTMPESVISQENNSPLTLHVEFQNFCFSWISIVQLIKFNHKCMHNRLSPNIPKHKSRGKMHFHEKWKNFEICVQFH